MESTGKVQWTHQIQEIRDAISRGDVAKVVLARQITVPLDSHEPWDALPRGDDHSTQFLLRHNGAAFAGVTPERLVAKKGLRVRSEALAGTAALQADVAAEDLYNCCKLRLEHDFVFREIVRCLQPFCRRVECPDEPSIRRLRHMQHLRTPIVGCLRERVHVLDLVAALHPTPAVAGVPRSNALRWIADHEPAPRGWYSGPIGSFDADGDGNFVVALRSALIADGLAYLYAGAGIDADSDAEQEYAETQLKLGPMLELLAPGWKWRQLPNGSLRQ
jgi:isochorismate synthase